MVAEETRADEKVPPALAIVEVGTLIHLRATWILVYSEPGYMRVFRTWLKAKPVACELYTMNASHTTEEKPYASGLRIGNHLWIYGILNTCF